MKVLHVTPLLGYGGVERVIRNYFEQLDHSKVMFDFIGHGAVEPYHQDLINEGCKIYYFSTLGKLGYRAYKNQVQSCIDMRDYDIVHIHVGHLTGVYARVFRELGAKHIICHAHTTKCVNPKHSVFMPILRYLANHYSDYRIACGVDAGKFCFGKGSYTVISNGLSYCKINNIDSQAIENIKKELCLVSCPFIIGHVGHFSAPKNHMFIVQIIKAYLKINPHAKFVLVGDGPMQEKIKSIVNNNGNSDSVVFAGVRNDIYACMKMFDAFILPSLHEGLPVVGIEAQAAGIPCIFSENIDKAVDIGVDLAKFIPIDKGVAPWICAIDKLRANSKIVKSEDIYSALCEHGYELTSSAHKLMQIYTGLLERICNE